MAIATVKTCNAAGGHERVTRRDGVFFAVALSDLLTDAMASLCEALLATTKNPLVAAGPNQVERALA